ncbi:hypothetical protein PR048_015413 [Dryococelus australis]|uniref:Uncharacterized protein n=1 Tax=Dryococelus australis TaxID=614101 RepID=A0ABQ9HH60_9NEOP|nr:hypothetical protein PR048_015413 [Dryococelus australis]
MFIVKKDVKQRCPRKPDGKERAASFIYNVQVGSNRVKVNLLNHRCAHGLPSPFCPSNEMTEPGGEATTEQLSPLKPRR